MRFLYIYKMYVIFFIFFLSFGDVNFWFVDHRTEYYNNILSQNWNRNSLTNRSISITIKLSHSLRSWPRHHDDYFWINAWRRRCLKNVITRYENIITIKIMNGNEIMYREKKWLLYIEKKNLSHNSTVMGGGVTR